jgi:hypothetical protein
LSSGAGTAVATTDKVTSSSTGSGTSLVLVPGLPPVTSGSGATTGSGTGTAGSGSTTPAAAAGAATPPTPQTPMDVLSAALLANGINPASLGLVQTSTPVWYPGGGWINNLISMNSPTGQHNFTVELMLLNPQVTVNEIKKIIAGTDSPPVQSFTGRG